MGQILFAGGGGGAVGSDDLTATASQVLQGQTYMGNDTDDDIGTGTMPNIAAIDDGVSLAVSGDNLYCRMHNGAHIQNASPGYPEVSYNLATVRSAINYTDSSKVLNDTTICGMTGSMVDRGIYQYATSFGNGNDGSNDYVAFNALPEGYYHSNGYNWAPEIRMIRSTFKNNVINYFGIASVTNFSVAQYSSQTLLFTWANPSWGMWSGIRIVGNQNGWPSSPDDGTVFCDSNSGYYTTWAIATGTWYFRAWNYVTVSEGRWYGGYSEISAYNSNISGEVTFTYGQSWTVPTAVRQIQYFLVGGGGGSYINSGSSSRSSNGGGGGYIATGYANVEPGQVIYICVGSGGSWGDGWASSLTGAVNVSAAGGYAGTQSENGSGYGGSGGGASALGTKNYAGNGGSNGADGDNNRYNQGLPGKGQGWSTTCPWDGTLYAGGGGGGSNWDSNGGGGGSGGGGYGGEDGADGQANTGGGGGGCGRDSNDGSSVYSSGGSGIVRIRW